MLPKFSLKNTIAMTFIRLVFLLIPVISYADNKNSDESISDYVFDLSLFNNANINKLALARLSNGNDIIPGTYKVDLYINHELKLNLDIRFKETQSGKVEPCFSQDQLEKAQIITRQIHAENIDNTACHTLDSMVNGGTFLFDFSQLRLDLTIPHSSLQQLPRGYIPEADLHYGHSIVFLNYYTNLYQYNYEASNQTQQQQSIYLALNGGINFGLWQFRQQSNLSHNQILNQNRNSNSQWNIIRSYVKRPLIELKSEFSAGQLTTSGRFFSGLSFSGINLTSDERMLPESQRGYAPVVQGTANTTAKVSILQNGREIYQTTVAPGPFRITDLYPTNYNGDLDVVITEADGSFSQYKVPFSAVPESIRQGSFRYNLDLGQTRNIGEDTLFSNLNLQYGVSNAITINTGVRLAEQYQALMAGTAYTSFLGAFGTEATYSHSTITEKNALTGWMLGANYSKTFNNTNTTIALAGYRFSTEGYRDLVDVISLRQAEKDGVQFNSNTYLEQSRAVLILNQSLNELGTLYLSGSRSRYRDSKPNDQQLQVGYGKTFQNGVSTSATFSRQKTGLQNINHTIKPAHLRHFEDEYQNSFSLAVNIPLQRNRYRNSLTLHTNHHKNNHSQQATLTGSFDKFNDLNYHIGINHDNQSNLYSMNSGLNKRFNYANTSLNFSAGRHFWQSSASIQGALALHDGGTTFAPYLSDTFALISAPGAVGASPINSQGIKINSNGYALIPTLTPYRHNHISINPEGMPINTELLVGTIKIAPYAGATVKMNFKTRKGYAMLIQSALSNGDSIPIGSDVFNSAGESIGMTGQNGQIYIRTAEKADRITVKWGNNNNDKCIINYGITSHQLHSALIRAKEVCLIGADL